RLINPVEGKPVYTIFSYAWAGLSSDEGNPMGYIEGEPSSDYKELTNALPEELIYHGSAVPLYYGSLLNSFRYKNLSFSFNIMYNGGYFFRRPTISYQSLFNNWNGHPDYRLRWQKPGDENKTDVPSMIYPNDSQRDSFFNYSEPTVEKGDHIRIRNMN